MRTPLKSNALVAYAIRLVWMLGCLTILNFAHKHWPIGSMIATSVFLLGCAGWYLWRFVVQPFRSGLRGERE